MIFIEPKKKVKKLGHGYRKIDYCLNVLMSYYKDDQELT